jgi:hypothetical protein
MLAVFCLLVLAPLVSPLSMLSSASSTVVSIPVAPLRPVATIAENEWNCDAVDVDPGDGDLRCRRALPYLLTKAESCVPGAEYAAEMTDLTPIGGRPSDSVDESPLGGFRVNVVCLFAATKDAELALEWRRSRSSGAGTFARAASSKASVGDINLLDFVSLSSSERPSPYVSDSLISFSTARCTDLAFASRRGAAGFFLFPPLTLTLGCSSLDCGKVLCDSLRGARSESYDMLPLPLAFGNAPDSIARAIAFAMLRGDE